MTGYILKRIAVAILTLLLIMTITFLLMNAIPGSPFLTEKSTPEMIAKANAKYGLDKYQKLSERGPRHFAEDAGGNAGFHDHLPSGEI